MIVACPSCGTQLSVGEELAGHLVSCSQCSNSFSIPQAAQAVYVAPPSVSTSSRYQRKSGSGVSRVVGVAFVTLLLCCGGPIGMALMIGKEGIRKMRAEIDRVEPDDDEGDKINKVAATPKRTQVTAAPPPVVRKPEETVTAATLCRDYESNEVSADRRWKGKYVRVTGKVTAVSRAVFGDGIYVMLEGDSFREVQCFLKKSQASKAESLKVGNSSSIVGTVDGLFSSVWVKDAEIEY